MVDAAAVVIPLLLILCSSTIVHGLQDLPPMQSRWTRRTAKRRLRTENLLSGIIPPSFLDTTSFDDVHLPVLDAPEISWECFPDLDPQQGGSLPAGSARALRKRRAVEAFAFVARTFVGRHDVLRDQELVVDDTESVNDSDTLIVDAASGAGNLSVPLASMVGRVLAIDINEIALQRLSHRCPNVATMCADLAADIKLPPEASVVCSLHGCGSASDLAIQLAVDHRLPFVISPCCTAKAITPRVEEETFSPDPIASFQRSGAPSGLLYPRSEWLSQYLNDHRNDYILLAKVADIGLGPQVSEEQHRHQRIAKLVVECDRLSSVLETEDYGVQLLRLRDHEGYGKPEIMIGTPNESKAASRWNDALIGLGIHSER